MIQSRLTSTGKIFFSLVVLFYAAAVTSQSGLLLFLIGVIGGCLLANWFYARNVLQGLEVEAPSHVFISEGSGSDQPWKITNRGKRVAEQVDLFSAAGRLFRIRALSAKVSTRILPELTYTRRGVYPHDGLKLVTSAPFGLVVATRKLQLAGEVVVYPKIYEPPPLPVAGSDMVAGGKLTGKRRVASGTHFAGVRLWQPGDPFKQIHWKSSARGQDLMVKTFEEELSGRLAVVLNCAGSDTALVDDCVRAAGSLLMTALDAGHMASLWDPTRQSFVSLPPFADGGELLYALARFEPVPIRDWTMLAAQVPRKSAVALVTSTVGQGERIFLSELSRAGRRPVVYHPADLDPGILPSDQVYQFEASRMWAASFDRGVAA